MLAIFGAVVPRLLLFVGWYNDAAYWGSVFGSPVWLLGGFLVLPWTTFIYGFVQRNGLSPLNWVFLIAAVCADLGTWGIGFLSSRKEYSAYRGT